MRFSTRGRYGVQIMVDLAQHTAEGPISLKSVADRQKLSENYLEQLVPELRRAGLVKSIRGPQGGYILAKKPEDINIGDVIRVLEGPIAPVECDKQAEKNCCEKTKFCVNREVWVRVRDSINDVVNSITLADLLQDNNKNELINGG
ncbi:Rrf2 family transcriptional regulator [Dehalobacter sp. DCM]|uniref:RrF2 family transcriptional regulator n=1 Tax=Dehalobacter sp. DCM TaxID=2907827 RepID=UPI003081F737|nr:Rrf2 family transcriptional regulator [Dehalobacter sp. DCM]